MTHFKSRCVITTLPWQTSPLASNTLTMILNFSCIIEILLLLKLHSITWMIHEWYHTLWMIHDYPGIHNVAQMDKLSSSIIISPWLSLKDKTRANHGYYRINESSLVIKRKNENIGFLWGNSFPVMCFTCDNADAIPIMDSVSSCGEDKKFTIFQSTK